MMNKPTFFVVGAPKAGTTGMCKHLSQHPEIFIPPKKELNYFCTDLADRQKKYSLEEYLNYFEEGADKICGEGTPLYLPSKFAAQKIYNFDNHAKIIIMLREPVSLLYSLHSQYLYNGSSEDIQSFQEAINAEDDRRQGNRIPQNCKNPKKLIYREFVRYSEQVKRYLDLFGEKQVHIVIFDDLKSDFPKVYREVLKFLEVDPNFQPEFYRANANKTVRNVGLQKLIKYPPAKVLELGKFLIPLPQSVRRSLLEGFKNRLKQVNTQKVDRPPLSAEFRHSLQGEFAAEIQSLSNLIGRDLTHWSSEILTTTRN